MKETCDEAFDVLMTFDGNLQMQWFHLIRCELQSEHMGPHEAVVREPELEEPGKTPG